MQKIADFIMSKKFIPVFLALVAASFFIAFKSQGLSEKNDNPIARHEEILRNVGILLEGGHYSPRKIDNDFSKLVLDKFLKDLDGEKNIFLESDIKSFNIFENVIDDEIHGEKLESFYSINEVYQKRLFEVSSFYAGMLLKPFDFTTNETIEMDPDKKGWPANEKSREDFWKKRIKFLVLSKFVDSKDEQVKNKDKKDFVLKADSTIERESRESVKKILDRMFSTRKARETQEFNFSTFVNSITSAMDPHTTYFPPIDLRSFNESMSGRFYGIGAQLREDDGKIKVGPLITGGPAWKGGELKENDEILKVGQGNADPVDVTGYDVSEAVKIIRGSAKGSEVRLTIKRGDGTLKVISIIRDEIKLEDIFAKSAIIKGENKIGYINLPEFYADFERPDGARCAVDVAIEIKKLKDENIDGLILDLRGNGGGSLYDVVQMVGLFIDEGPVVQVKGRDGKVSILRDREKGILYDGPFTVLVDETSASASEIFAAAIQDYQRGIILGSTSTYGKGTVQRNIPLTPISENRIFTKKSNEDLGTVKLTVQKFYRINGGATQLRGVVSDVIIPDRLEYIKFREKDNIYSLKWDEIPSLSYKPWVSTYSLDPIITEARSDVNKSATFNKIKADVTWLGDNADRAYPLNITKYKEKLKEQKNVYKSIEEAYKLPATLNVRNLYSDTSNINLAIDKVEKNKVWLKRVQEDIFIDEGVKVIDKMILHQNFAKKE